MCWPTSVPFTLHLQWEWAWRSIVGKVVFMLHAVCGTFTSFLLVAEDSASLKDPHVPRAVLTT